MRARVTDAASLSRITPVVLNNYLGMMGWNRQDTWQDRIVIWSIPAGTGAVEALVPLREESAAYATRIAETLSALERVEERSQLEIFYDVLGAGSDIIRLSSPNAANVDAWSLDRDAALLSAAKDMMMVSARTAEMPGRAILHGRPSAQAQDYVRRLRVVPAYGAADNTLTIQSTVPPSFGVQRELGNDADDPFARAVVRTLKDGLYSAFDATQKVLGGEDESVFGGVSSKGVSANLCEAIASLVEIVHGLQIEVAWARVREPEDPGSRVIFGESTAAVLTSGAGFLRRTNPVLDVVMHGEIVRLDRNAQKYFNGKVVVLAEFDGEWQRFDTQFDVADRDAVRRAFEEKLWITVSGDVYRRGSRREIRNPTSLTLAGKIDD